MPEKLKRVNPGGPLLHQGRSMHPALRHGDLLEVKAAPLHELRPGDVVACRPPGARNVIVHRVNAVTPAGLKTRGDNVDCQDSWTLGPEHLVGRVDALLRRERRIAVRGGRRGAMAARRQSLRRRLERTCAPLLGRAYRTLARTTPFRFVFPPALQPKLVRFRTPEGEARKILLGGRVIGEYDGTLGRWRIRRPFRLLVARELLDR